MEKKFFHFLDGKNRFLIFQGLKRFYKKEYAKNFIDEEKWWLTECLIF